MERCWHVLVEYAGSTYPVMGGLGDQDQAESAALRTVGGGVVLTSGLLSERQASRIGLRAGQVFVTKWESG